MPELTINEIAEIKNLVEKQKKATIKWVSTISGVNEDKIIENASLLGLIVEEETIRIPMTPSERGVKIIYDNAEIVPPEQSIDEIPIPNPESNDYTFGFESKLEQVKTIFSPGLRGVIRFCRFDILIIIYALATIAGIALLILRFYEIFSFLILGVSSFILIIIAVGFSIVFPKMLMIIDNELIIKQFFKKEIIDINDIVLVTFNSQKRPRNIFRRKNQQQYDNLIFTTDEHNYTFSLKHFEKNKSNEIKKIIIDMFRIISDNNGPEIRYEE